MDDPCPIANARGNNVKIAAFYLGCAVEIVLNSQRIRLKSEPFRHKLNGLNIDMNYMEKIVKEVKNKADDYREAEPKKFPFSYFNSLIVHYTKAMANLETISPQVKTEISYAFSLGLVMEQEFRSNRKKDKNNSQEEES